MAKYTRFDPRNKKQNRNKTNYRLNRDSKIHDIDTKKRSKPNYTIDDINSSSEDEYFYN